MIWGSAGFLIGTVLGSFAYVLADRSLGNQTSLSPGDKSFLGRSYCPKCQHKLAWYDLFPILSFIILQGKCRYCRKKIGIEYLLIEAGVGILVGFLFWQSFFMTQCQISNVKCQIFLFELLFKTFFITVLVILFLTDFKKMLIPDRIVKPAIVVGILSLAVITIYKIGYLYYYLSQSPIGKKLLPPFSDYFQRHALQTAEPFFYAIVTGLIIGGFFLSLIIVTRGKGMGGGDVWLGGYIGIMLGFPQALLALILSFFTGAVFSIALIIAGKKHFGQTIPFGPFLVLGSLTTLFWGNDILSWYLSLRI